MWCITGTKENPRSTIAKGSPLWAIAIISGILLGITNPAEAQNLDTDLQQINSVSELKDVQPTDWAYQALQQLVERYGCIVGYPNGTFAGNRPLSRYEFAAGLNACLQQIENLLAASEAVTKEDLEKLQRLTQDYQAELAAIGGRVDNLEARTAFLEDHQFSTSTKLNAQMIWGIQDTFGDRVGGNSDDTKATFAQRTRLNLETSFTGKDLLRTRLEFGNFGDTTATTGTNMTALNYNANTGNTVILSHLLYRTPIGSNLSITAGPVGIGYTDITDTLTPPTIADDSLGIPSKFGEYSPLYRQGGGGVGVNWNIVENLTLTVGYLAGDPSAPEEGKGLFNGSYNALAQLAYYGDWGAVGIAYSHYYAPQGQTNLTGSTGSFLAEQPFGDGIATSANVVGLQGFYRFTPNFQIHAWGAYTNASAEGSGVTSISNGVGGDFVKVVEDGDSADIWYGAIGFTFPDVGGEGNMPGLLIGIPPVVSSSDVRSSKDTSYHIEAFYRLKINDYISVTPGVWAVINPENDSRNATQVVGHIRTSFNF